MSKDIVSEAIDFLSMQSKNKMLTVGVTGLPGSGKTTLCTNLCTYFGKNGVHVPMDDFCVLPTTERKRYLSEALAQSDDKKLRYLAAPLDPHENPYADPATWYDFDALADTVEGLKSGRTTKRYNAWDQKTGLCNATRVFSPPSEENTLTCIFIDGTYVFEKSLFALLDAVIIVELSAEEAHARESKRDSHRSDQIYLDYKKLVTQLYCVPYIERNRTRADLILRQ